MNGVQDNRSDRTPPGTAASAKFGCVTMETLRTTVFTCGTRTDNVYNSANLYECAHCPCNQLRFLYYETRLHLQQN